MAQFILKLLTPTLDNGGLRFLETTISEFYSQTEEQKVAGEFHNQRHSFCYSFNEKLNLHQNTQKELSFSMLRNVWVDNVLTINPFASAIHDGSQLLLIDKFNNHHFFTVKSINYKLNKENITYEISCQDSFTYQMIRQGDGYSIDNSVDSSDFIGAKSIDWWVLKKIKPECHIPHQYVPLFQGVYRDSFGSIRVFNKGETISNVDKILKQPYDENEFAEYYEKLPFSGSGNASSIIISLADLIGMNIHVEERLNDSGTVSRYFWFEPKKKEETSDLKYSPDTTIQSFDFSHVGDSLTTVLNVDANVRNEDNYVSLLPDIPAFFKRLFESTAWSNTTYYDGFFTSVCQHEVLNLDQDFKVGDVIFEKETEPSNYIDIPLYNKNGGLLTIPMFYEKINFITTKVSAIMHRRQEDIFMITPYSNIINLVIKKEGVEYEFNDTYSTIDQTVLGKPAEAYLRVYGSFSKPAKDEFLVQQLLLNFYRDVNEEELAFAEIADKIPWLESKLINLQYFLDQNIISKTEYNSLMNILKNDLRIVNGKIILHSSAYAEAVRNKIDKLATLTSQVDTLGAVFTAEVLEPLNNNQKSFDTTKFTNTYNEFKKAYPETSSKQFEILDYGELLTENFNNYFNAQQRFLKNVYEFKKYFNEPVCLNGQYKLYNIDLDINTDNKGKDLDVGFSHISFSKVNEDYKAYDEATLKPLKTIYESNFRTVADIVDATNYQNYYYAKIVADDLSKSNGHGYNAKQTYYRVAYVTNEEHIVGDEYVASATYGSDMQDVLMMRWKKDKDRCYYIIKDKTLLDDENDYELAPEIEGFTKTLQEISFYEIVGEYLFRKQLAYLDSDTPTQWYEQNPDTYTPTTEWLDRNAIQTFMANLTPEAIILMGINDEAYSSVIQEESQYSDESREKLVRLYVENFPVTSVKYVGPKHIQKSYTLDGVTSCTQRINSKGDTWVDYYNKITNDQECQKPSDYEWETTLDVVTPVNVASYYRQTVCDASAGWGTGIGGTVSVIGGVIGSVIGFVVGFFVEDAFGGGGLGWQIGSTPGRALESWIWQAFKEWRNTGWNDTDVFGNPFDERYFEGYFFEDKKNNEQHKTYWNYVTSPDAKANFDQVASLLDTEIELIYSDGEVRRKETNKLPLDYAHCFEHFGLTYPLLKYLGEQQKPDKNEQNVWSIPHPLSDSYDDSVAKIRYKESYYRFLKPEDYVNPQSQYVLIIQDEDKPVFRNLDNFDKLISDNSGRLSIMKYYPLVMISKPLYVNNMNFDSTSMTVEEMLSINEVIVTNEDSYRIAATTGDSNKTFYVAKLENYDFKARFNENPDFKEARQYKGLKMFDEKDGKIDFFKLKDITDGCYFYATKNDEVSASNMQKMIDTDGKIKEIDEESTELCWVENDGTEHTHFYKKNSDGTFDRVYSILQAKKFTSEHYYWATTSSYSTQLLQSDTETILPIDIQLYHYEYKTDEDGSQTIKTHMLDDLVHVELTPETNKKTISVKVDEDNVISFDVDVSIGSTEVTNSTNGLFAMMYRDLSDFPLIQEKAALIEKELSLYWSQAYAASKSCEYFLPEHWLPKIDGDNNPFFGQIVHVNTNVSEVENSNKVKVEVVSAKLLDTFLPSVSIYSNNQQQKLPTYQLKHHLMVEEDDVIEDDILKRVEQSNITPATNIEHITPIKKAFENIGAEISDFYVETNEYSSKVYYYVSDEFAGGTKWKDVFKNVSNIQTEFGKFNGNYMMIYDVLSRNFKKDTKYETLWALKKKQSNIWENIYKNYSGVVLEKNYSNEDATTSLELYNVASLTFKGLAEPERNYNISVINTNTLHGFIGQEITIGEGILIDAEEYYSEYDDIKKTLSQYLFVSDMSYDLRKDSDISLTVNNIKYEDKLIQRLAKLIK